MLNRLKTFVLESRQELRHVNWPTRKEGIRLTLLVIFFSIALAAYLGFFDYFFSYLVRLFVIKA
jgi:preprotein translocase SecE subunit